MDKLEIHYYLKGGSHAMDALIKHEADAALYKIFNEAAQLFEISDLKIEIEALKEGGIRQFLKLSRKTKKKLKNATLILAFVTAVLSFTNELHDFIENNKPKGEVEKIIDSFIDIDRYRSDYYKAIVKEDKITSVDFIVIKDNELQKKHTVRANDFKDFIFEKDWERERKKYRNELIVKAIEQGLPHPMKVRKIVPRKNGNNS